MPTDEQDWFTDPVWYKDAIIYQLHVKAFFDGTNDGVGDFKGLAKKLDYVQDLGVNTIWLLPFYPSPMKDDGYDTSDYRNIHPDYGNRRDFRQFVREAHRRGIKVVTELIINHTSDQHPWFQAARRAPPESAKRSFYVWSDNDQTFPETRIIFTDTETSNWAWDPVAQQYYWHRFFSHQPDLNHNNPQVVKAVIRVMRFWLDMGVDGLRLDAIPYLCVREGTNNENLTETHQVIKQMRGVVDEHYQYRMFLAEANQWPEDVREYFGRSDECHMAYHFPLMPRMYMAVAQEDRHPIVEIMRQTPEIPDDCQWAIFLRNHDELTLEMVTDRERDYMYEAYAYDTRMRVNVGIRRRLAPLMDNNPDKIKLMNSLLMSMTGSPIVYYGDEIGMGDNIYLGDRNAVRTPMQWSPDRNAGFSKADPQRLYLPPIMDAVYGYQAVNVEAQSRDPSSLLNWMKRIIAVRKSSKAFGRGTLEFLHPGNRKILAYIREYRDESILCVANMAHTAQPVELDLSRFKGRVPIEMMGHIPFPPIGDLPYLLTLHGHGVYWFRLATEAEVPSWHEEHLPPLELPVLVLSDQWRSFFPEHFQGSKRESAQKVCTQFEREVIPHFLPAQRWFATKDEAIRQVELLDHVIWGRRDQQWLLARIRVTTDTTGPQMYFLPLTMIWEEDPDKIWHLLHFTLAKVRQQAKVGFLVDAFSDTRFVHQLVATLGERTELSYPGGRIVFSPTSAYREIAGELPPDMELRRPSVESSNTTVLLDEKIFVKGYRRLQPGINPEVEIGRFLTEVSPFPHVIPVAGTLEQHGGDGEPTTLAIAQAYVENQGDAWNYTLDYLDRFLETCKVEPAAHLLESPESEHAGDLMMMHRLGLRTGGLHCALAVESGDPAFDPEPVSAKELNSWTERIRLDVIRTLDELKRVRDVPGPTADRIDEVLVQKAAILRRVSETSLGGMKLAKSRYHGDYHLGQVLVVENDFVIIDFEGEPARPLAERRAKNTPLRDVAGMLRSFSYAAYAALHRLSADRPADFEIMEPFARKWQDAVSRAFLDGYEEAIRGSRVYPEDSAQANALIQLLILEKALYELRYEMANRPDWLLIPLRGVLDFSRAG